MESKAKNKYETIDEYIASQPASIRDGLEQIRNAIQKNAPGAEEVISYQMPAFRYHGMLVYFAAFKNHYGFYGMPEAIKQFKDRLKNYELSKGTIRFPFNKQIPVKLIADIVKFRVKENLHREQVKKSEKNKKKK